MTVNISLNQLSNLQNENTAVTQINQNSNTLTTAFGSALNTTGDRMQGNLDMNGFQVLNQNSGGSSGFINGGLVQASFSASGVNFNSATTDTPITISLPSRVFGYQIVSVRIYNASTSLTSATFGAFTGTGGTGTVLVTSSTAISVSSSVLGATNNIQQINAVNAVNNAYNNSILYFRVVNPAGVAATANVSFQLNYLY